MHQEFYTASHVINSFARTVTGPDEVELKVRAKTFDLLLLLISRPGEVLSKQQILAECWQNVVVDDAVVVQSIKELRKLLAGSPSYQLIHWYRVMYQMNLILNHRLIHLNIR
jgi:DNA-binding winged helix-turn-helix (wHTH) protein